MTGAPAAAPPDPTLATAQARYRYLPPDANQLAPICMAESWPWLEEQYGPSWILRFLPGFLRAQANHLAGRLRRGLQYATFRFDPLDAYDQLLGSRPPDFVRAFQRGSDAAHDAAFAWWRIAGANPLVLRRERELDALRARIPLSPERIERALGRPVDLAAAAREDRLFVVDFRLLLAAIRWERPEAPRDSRWREKYLPTPVGVFLSAPEAASGLLPIALRIDGPENGRAHNPVYYPDDGWGWRIAKSYFEAADINFQNAYGHDFGTHLMMEPFAMATPRQLPRRHPVRLLLEPHTRFTLAANQAAYKYLIDRSELFAEIFSATLEQQREATIQAYLQRSFLDSRLESDLASRGVADAPAVYPYRDDLRLWLAPIQEFVRSYVEAFYTDDAAVAGDAALQAWKQELIDPKRGSVRRLTPGDRLDDRATLVDLLAHALFIAGPGHASQHFPSKLYHRYAPAFPAGVYLPPPLEHEPVDFPRWLATLPPIDKAADEVRASAFAYFQYDRFGDYERYALARLPEARAPIARLRQALAGIEETIRSREADRLFSYDFLLPSRVPNSANI